jgi:UDP-N-acetyl-D-galactosamine dehydrogenase
MIKKKDKLAIIGLGYVGLPLAVEFSKYYEVVGFDISLDRINELNNYYDRTLECDTITLQNLKNIIFTCDPIKITNCNIYVITVPTPIDKNKAPNLLPLIEATTLVGGMLNKNDIVIYESTVYPGCTEEDCVPILENTSKLIFNKDFFCGYSPERINPGDKINTLTNIIKVTSGSNSDTAIKVDNLYKSIIKAGTFKASSIKVAEASKAIENAQRDVNISFINELALIFDKIGINTVDVLNAAATKWNFQNYKPGLVGGHCIGVDPYYLAYKSESLGYYPAVILSGRRVNEGMSHFVVNKLLKIMIRKEIQIKNSRILILGITFKENCPDIRNTRVIDVYKELIAFGCNVDVLDPWAKSDEVKRELSINIKSSIDDIDFNIYDGIILAVAHDLFKSINILKREKTVIFDLKNIFPDQIVDSRL